MSLELRIACEADAEAIAALVNRAYRPSPKDRGWTHEANLISGERTTAEQVISLLHERSVILLLCIDQKIAACVHVQEDESNAYIGMLTTAPELQAKGLGKEMLSHAEKYALENFRASAFKMSILSLRPELLAFYERRGYALTGEAEAYPSSAGVGQPIVDGIRVLSLLKRPDGLRSSNFAVASKNDN